MVTGSNGKPGGNGAAGASDARLTRQELIEAIESGHEFPGLFAIVLIARHDPAFRERLDRAVVAIQGGAPFDIRERESRKGNYVSYHVEVFVESAEEALDRRTAFSALPGVLLLL